MKKFIYILFIALLATACVEPFQPYLGPVINEPEEGVPVTLEFSLPPVTKGTMAHNPTINTIHVAVFNQAGILKQYEQATLTTPGALADGDQGVNNPKYTVSVNMSSTPRILHFIADSPIMTQEALIAAAGTSGEAVILNALTTAGGATAYWQRIELERIDAYTYQGGKYGDYGEDGATQYTYTENNQPITVFVGDFIKRDGKKVLDGTGYFQSDYVKGKVANIPLVRNFAEITVKSGSESNFTPVKYALVNVPKAGYVAPFDTKKGEFASAYINAGTTGLDHSTIYANGNGYPGSLAGSIDQAPPTNFINAGVAAYMYERPIPTTSQPPTCILVAGVYNKSTAKKDSDGNTWFKIELADVKGGYFPVYRGLSYDFEIGNIDGTDGCASADEALAADPIGDVSTSVTTATLEQISDGKGTTLWVEYIDYVATQAENKTLYYTMFYQSEGDTTYLTDRVTLTVKHPNANYKAINKAEDDQITGSLYTGTGTPDSKKRWYVATIPLNQSGTNNLHSKLIVEGSTPVATGSKKMRREVNYHVMGTQKFQNGNNVLTGTSLKNEEANQETTLTIYMPSDLGLSMFPLTLRIEAENGNFTTKDGLPVESGQSLFDASKNAFYFLKTIEYDDYKAFVDNNQVPKFTAKFKTTRDGTTTAARTNATHFRVLDKIKTNRTTPYFEYAECYVSVGGPVFNWSFNGQETNSASVNADVTHVTLTLTSTGNENTTWTLTPSSNISSLESTPSFTTGYSGSGNATITVTIPANTDTENAKTYTIKANRQDFDEQEFTITQAKVTSKKYTINLNNSWGDNNTVSVEGWDSSNYYSYQSNSNYNVSSSIATMSVTVYGYTEFTVHIASLAESTYDYVIVRKIGSDPYTPWSAGNAYRDAGTKASTRGNQGYIVDVTFTTEDGLTDDSTPHTFYIQFGKDGNTNESQDRGYVFISKEYTFVSN